MKAKVSELTEIFSSVFGGEGLKFPYFQLFYLTIKHVILKKLPSE